ncbi:hypothetical protein [Cereibacter sphaeroides]|uniref:hypothetical protein n=1 Tax=Cereibacter sphaeroides TaxID=1063 RepID=UPI0011AE2DCA|nr:hypothetical protein [Cereibacter sphaeroides]
MKILEVRDPVWANEQKTRINCIIRTSTFAKELPFTASPDDVEEHGREIFKRCVNGDFGEVKLPEGEYEKFQDIAPGAALECNTGKSSGWLEAWPEIDDFIREVNSEVYRKSPRAIGLVWGSMLERMLKTFVKSELARRGRGRHSLRCSPKDSTEGPRKSSGTFRDLIAGAHFEGFIDRDLFDHLEAIRAVRNACAHEWKINDSNPAIRELHPHLNLLRNAYVPEFLPEDFDSMMQLVFGASCCTIMIQLAERISSGKP